MERLWQDVRYATRVLMKKPGFAAVAVLTLALGIGANTAIFSVVNAVLLRPLPYRDPARIFAINKAAMGKGLPGIAAFEYFDWRDQSEAFEQIAGYSTDNFNLTGGDEPERITVARVTANLFPLLGVQPISGRVFMPEEDAPGHGQVVVVSQGFWQRRYGGDPGLIGQTITLNDKTYTVVGIMPASFRFPQTFEIWMPLALDEAAEKTGDTFSLLEIVARIKPQISIERAQADLNTIEDRVAEKFPGMLENTRIEVVPLHAHLVGEIRPALLLLLGAVCFVLLIACANVANLLLARASSRQKEIAIRSALGARRSDIMRQLLTESIMLALAGGALGILLALWGVDLLLSGMPGNIANSLPGIKDVGIDRQVLGFTLFVSILTGIFFGLAPALIASKPNLNETLKEGGGKTAFQSRSLLSLRSLLVVSELALALVLLIGAGLMIKSFARLLDVKPGYNPENVLTLRVDLPRNRYADSAKVSSFYQQVLEKTRSLSGVKSVGAISHVPLNGFNMIAYFNIEGVPKLEPAKDRPIGVGAVNADYFRAMQIPLLQGRELTDSDAEGSPRVALINEAMARRFFPDQNPLGKRISYGCGDELCRTIVGVVGDVRQDGWTEEAGPEIYVPYAQRPTRSMTLLVRTDADPLSLAASVRSQVFAVDSDQPVADVKTLEERISDAVAQPRLIMLLLGVFGALALILATVGVYGVMSYTVTQRTREIGIRMALGASARDVLRLIVRQVAIFCFVGVSAGLVGAFALTRLMESLLFGVSATDPSIFILISVILIGVALGASFIPARRATKVDPMVALRYE